ncbi:MAG: mechanosensitive ion channel, partial [Hyphomonadaceae bacterium]|nr:mechanosensitive ion channel [Hyphomonadaceae bacterium]
TYTGLNTKPRHMMILPSPQNTSTGTGPDLTLLWANLSQWWQETLTSLTSWDTVWQGAAILIAGGLAYLLSRYPRRRLLKSAENRGQVDVITRAYTSLAGVLWPIFTVILLWVAVAAFDALDGLENGALRVVASLLNAWIVVRVVTSNMREGFAARAIAVLAWSVAALYILRLLDPVTGAMEAATFTIAGQTFSLLRIVTSVVIAILALWLGRLAGDAAQSQLRAAPNLNPSISGLLGQVLKVGFMTGAILFAVSTLGIDLTALAVFTGALGVGIGFGLQSIFSNFISGIIILFERSIKVGDFIELQSGVTGSVREINIRSTLVTTNDNVDILVPNEEFIKAQVINWTLREARRRIRIPFGVAYGSDKDLVKKAGLEAAAEVAWTYTADPTRAPTVWLVGFGDSSLDFELVVWLTEEAVSKPARVNADYYWALHTALYKYELEIPFPQRDINFRNAAGVRLIPEDMPEGSET